MATDGHDARRVWISRMSMSRDIIGNLLRSFRVDQSDCFNDAASIAFRASTRHIVNLVQNELANMEKHITRIEVHLSDANSDKTGQDDVHCMLEVRLEGLQPTVVKEAAAKGAAVKMKHALESILGKRSDRR